MDSKDFEDTDKAMSKRVDAIYFDPSRHAFLSQFQYDADVDLRGPRGGKIRGVKTLCCHCNRIKAGHADTTEQL